MSELTIRKTLMLLALTSTAAISTVGQAAPIRLDLPTLFQMRPKLQAMFNDERLQSGRDYPGSLERARLLMGAGGGGGKPTVYDPANSYARWGRLDNDYTELAIWRTLNGKAVVAVNYVLAGGPDKACGDYPCGSVTEVFAHNGTRFIDAPDDAQNVAQACNSYVSELLGISQYSPETSLHLSNALKKVVRQRAGSYRAWLGDTPTNAKVQCFLPRKGTTVMLGIATVSIVLAQKERPMPLLYFKFDKVRGTFTPSANP